MDTTKIIAYGRIPIFMDALMQVPCSKACINYSALRGRDSPTREKKGYS